MALKKCRECGGQVSTDAKACPHCGAKDPTNQNARNTWIAITIVLGVWAAIHFSGGGSRTSPVEVASSSVASTSSTDASSVPAQARQVPQRPDVAFQENRTIERELRHNSPKLYRELGIDKLMHAGRLKSIRGGEQAWCVGKSVGNEKAGCYIEFYVIDAEHDSADLWQKNNLCGTMVRWYANWGSPSDYKPDSGMASWMARGDLSRVMQIVNENWSNCQSRT